MVQPFVPDGSVVALDVSVLLRLSWLDVGQSDTMRFGPSLKRSTDVFGTIIDPDVQRLATPLDNPVKRSDYAQCRQVHIDLNGKPFTIEVVDHIERPECTPVFELI